MFPLEPPLYAKLALGSVWDGMQGLQTRSLLILGSGHAKIQNTRWSIFLASFGEIPLVPFSFCQGRV